MAMLAKGGCCYEHSIRVQQALRLLRREPQPGKSWAERPLAMLLEVMRFLIETPASVWRDLLV
jgi:hypothetical protein